MGVPMSMSADCLCDLLEVSGVAGAGLRDWFSSGLPGLLGNSRAALNGESPRSLANDVMSALGTAEKVLKHVSSMGS
jgi:hypothetical protein